MSITQEVAVKVLKLSELEAMAKEPMCPEPDVHVMLPQPSETMRGVVEKMKNLDSIVTISSNLQGVLRLRVKSDLANVETEWRNLSHPEMGALRYGSRLTQANTGVDANPSQADDDIDPAVFHSVDIEAKHLLKLLNAIATSNHTIACICSGTCLIAYVYIGDNREASADMGGVLTWFLSGHNEGI
jgi:HUS1 checkpoint protein